MAWSNDMEVLDQLRAHGLIVERLEVGTDKVVRCKVEGERERRGWYRLFEFVADDGRHLICGSYGIWRGDDRGAQKIDIGKVDVSPQQRAAMKKRAAEDMRRADEVRKADAARAARAAGVMWGRLLPNGHCDYLVRKGVQGYGVRYSKRGAMAVPMLDVAGHLHGLQIIRAPDDKRGLGKEYWPAGLAKTGHFHLIGGTPGWVLLIAEGYATAATLHAATMLPVAVAFDANNLAPVGEAIRKRYPNTKLLFCADDDVYAKCMACKARVVLPLEREVCPSCGKPHKRRNTGVDAASAAAIKVSNAAWVRPQFAEEQTLWDQFRATGEKLTDFNDLHMRRHESGGLQAVRVQIEARLGELGWRPPARDAISPNAGQGDGKLCPIATVEELLDRMALILHHGGAAFDRQEHVIATLGDVRDACLNKYVYREWSEHPARSIVRLSEVGFDPTGQDPAITCNLFGGWPTQPKAGSCERLLELLRYICSGDPNGDELFRWVLCWLAYPLQHPGAKMKSTLVLHGPQGAGKNLFFESYMAIFGTYGRVIGQDAIEDKHNDWASRKLFLIADEVVARSEVFHIKNKLKALITGDWIRINPKHVQAHDERNHCNLVFLSNETRPVVLEEDDRRHCVIWTPPQRSQAFYDDVRAEIRAGGIEALHHYLLHLDLGDFTNATRPPMTEAKSDLIALNKDTPERFWDECLEGELTGVKLRSGRSEDWHHLYRLWCQRTGHRPASCSIFVAALEKRRAIKRTRERYMRGQTVQGPHWVLHMDGERQPEGTDRRMWLGDQIAEVRLSIDDYKKGADD